MDEEMIGKNTNLRDMKDEKIDLMKAIGKYKQYDVGFNNGAA